MATYSKTKQLTAKILAEQKERPKAVVVKTKSPVLGKGVLNSNKPVAKAVKKIAVVKQKKHPSAPHGNNF